MTRRRHRRSVPIVSAYASTSTTYNRYFNNTEWGHGMLNAPRVSPRRAVPGWWVMMHRMGTWIKERGLLLANLALFAACFVGMIVSGVQVYNADQVEHGQPTVSLGGYLTSGDFVEATFENGRASSCRWVCTWC